MVDRTELDLMSRTRAEQAARINAEGHRVITTVTKPRAGRRILAVAALRLGAWLDPAAGHPAPEGRTKPAIA